MSGSPSPLLSTTPAKPWYESQVIWANLTSLIGMAVVLTGHSALDPGLSNDIATFLGTLAAALGQGYSIYARVRSTPSTLTVTKQQSTVANLAKGITVTPTTATS